MRRLLLFERRPRRLGGWLEPRTALFDRDLSAAHLSARRLVRLRERALENSRAAAADSHGHVERSAAPRVDDHLVDAAASEVSPVLGAANSRVSDLPRRLRAELARVGRATGRG